MISMFINTSTNWPYLWIIHEYPKKICGLSPAASSWVVNKEGKVRVQEKGGGRGIIDFSLVKGDYQDNLAEFLGKSMSVDQRSFQAVF